MNAIKKIVLTGGPCAGKTTALVKVIEHFSSLGFKVFTIPEVPTLFTQAGMDYLTDNKAFFYEGEKSTLEIQLALEDKFTQMAEQCSQPSIIICDRGALDISAYMDQATWNKITSEVGTSTMELRDHRYDAVIHMVSAADGAEKFYTTATNAQRLEKADNEGLAVARHLDKRVMEAWAGHSHLRVINNHENFENKINRVLKEISSVLGLPQPITEERKYRVEVTGEIPDSVKSEIIQTYLTAEPGAEVRLRKRIWEGKRVNVHTTIKRLPNHEQVEVERQVSNNLYDSLLQQADPYRRTIEKTRRSFIWKGQYFELDSYHSFNDGMQILETKGVASDEKVNFPPFIRVVEDITGRNEYYNYNLALRNQ
ncbi:AAA family ATPase [Prevotella sp. KH2C16]|uniref:AAA family ATPase n=1 Tax=Prevotella sp. KH2C16 TaxID=1855325 RepID=UPI0008E264C1|nr:AAA family ATPase [Prevotella sp. KH2C16]SFG10267.1 CYTH domain-containing protein [Prevotella sp. KH2C16]